MRTDQKSWEQIWVGGQNEEQVIPDRSREGTNTRLRKILLEYDRVVAGMALVRMP